MNLRLILPVSTVNLESRRTVSEVDLPPDELSKRISSKTNPFDAAQFTRARVEFRMAFATRQSFVWRLRSRSMELGGRTRIMAIVNLTPDSFSGDGHMDHAAAYASLGSSRMAVVGQKLALAAAVDAIDAGADIVDLGAESTRPQSSPISGEEEQGRLLPVLEGVLRERPKAIVSVDTYHASTARAALKAGAEIVNDVSGLTWDEEMAGVVAKASSGLVLMHTRGRPSEWAAQRRLKPDEVLPEVFAGLMEQLALAEASGIASERIVVDPGFGFGKRGTENFTLLAGLARLHELGRPLLAGISRKGFLGDAVKAVQANERGSVDARHIATVAANVTAVLAGAHILRVHDVQPAREAAVVADAVLKETIDEPWAALSE